MARKPLRPLIRSGGFYPSRKWTPLVYAGGYTTANGGEEPTPPPIEKTVTGNPIHITDALAKPVQALSVALEPIQDLHGYDNPWPAGGGKNKFSVADWFTAYDAGNTLLLIGNTTVFLPAGQYTLSFEYYVDGAPSVASFWRTYSEQLTAVDSTKQQEYYSLGLSTSATSWTAVTQTFTLAADGWFGIDNGQLKGGVHYRNIQVENGASKTSFAPYSNLCPISGFTGLNVYGTGKNLLKLDESEMISTGWNRRFPISLKAGTYIISCQNQFGAVGTEGANVTLTDENDATIIKQLTTGYTFGDSVYVGVATTLTEEEAAAVKWIRFATRASGVTFDNIVVGKLQLEKGSTATAYEAYVGTTLPVSWQSEAGTVYAGYLSIDKDGNVTLTGTHEIVDLGSNPSWNYYSYGGNGGGYNNSIIGPTSKRYAADVVPNAVCSALVVKSDNGFNLSNTGHDLTINANATVKVTIPEATDTETLKAALNGVQLVYELATPVTYTLSSVTVPSTVQGENNWWHDANGNITIEAIGTPISSDEPDALQSLNILLGGAYTPRANFSEPTDEQALNIILGR